jgi:hypothetical protein
MAVVAGRGCVGGEKSFGAGAIHQLTIHMMAVELGLPGSRGVIQHSRLMMGGLRARAAVKMQRVRG